MELTSANTNTNANASHATATTSTSSTKTPVVRGARACTVCRQAKMKCVGAEDGTKPCQRCIRSGAQCVFEKHRRGRKPGSKLSEASKMLRRLEKGLSNAKAKQPTSSHPHPSASTASFGQDPGPSPTNNLNPSGAQSDTDMDEEDDFRPDDQALYAAREIRKHMRGSFLDVVMNKEPPTEPARPKSRSPSDRASFPQTQPIKASPAQSPTRAYDSPQSYTTLFTHAPKDPVAAGIISEADVSKFFDAFFIRLNPFINLFDPELHTPDYVRSRSPFLFTTILMACCKFFSTSNYTAVRRLAQDWCVYTFAEGTESVEVVQALACMTYWKEPTDRRTWSYIGMACRMAVNLRLNRYVGGRQSNETIDALRERRNRERAYLVVFVHDRSLSMQTGKHWMLPEDELVRNVCNWHKEGVIGQMTNIRPEDVIVAAFVNLRLIGSEATNTFRHSTHTIERELERYNEKLDRWLGNWEGEMEKAVAMDRFHCTFLNYFQSHVRLFLNTFGLKLSNLDANHTPDSRAVGQCYQSARTNLQIVSKDFAGMHVLQYCQESITVMSAYAAIVLLKLLRNTTTMMMIRKLTRESVDEINQLIHKTADAYQNAGHVTGEDDSAAHHARFLRRLTGSHARHHNDRCAYILERVPPQGFSTIRPSPLLLGQPVDSFSMHRSTASHGMNPPHFAPLPIASNSAHHPPTSHSIYGVEGAVRNGLSRHGNGASAPFGGDSDESYFEYMIEEVANIGPFSINDGSPHSDIGFVGSRSGGAPEFPFGGATLLSNQYRDNMQMASYQQLPPIQTYAPNGFDLR